MGLFDFISRNLSNKTTSDTFNDINLVNIKHLSINSQEEALLYKSFFSIDVETTGLDTKNDKIIEIACCYFCNGEMNDSFSSFINPKVPIPSHITRITRITNYDVQKAPSEKFVLDKLMQFINSKIGKNKQIIFVAHNAKFDANFLNNAFTRNQIGINCIFLDTLEISKCITKNYFSSYKLTSLCQELKINNYNPHEALNDALSCGYLFIKLCSLNIEEYINNSNTLFSLIDYSALYNDCNNEFISIINNIYTDGYVSNNNLELLKTFLNSDKKKYVNRYSSLDLYCDIILKQDSIKKIKRKLFLEIRQFKDPKSIFCSYKNITLDNKKFHFIGEFNTNIDDLKNELINKHNIVHLSKLTKTTNYLVVGDKNNSYWYYRNKNPKIDRALQLQNEGQDIKIITEQHLINILQGNANYLHTKWGIFPLPENYQPHEKKGYVN